MEVVPLVGTLTSSFCQMNVKRKSNAKRNCYIAQVVLESYAISGV
jgi:hypothetical protein